MDIAHLFVRDEVLPSYFENMVGHAIAVLSSNFAVTQLDATHLRVPASAGVGAAVISIQGRPRWVEANVDRAHPGGAAGAYDVFVTAADQAIVNVPQPFTDNTNYGFALAIVASGATPPIVAGTVDIFRKVAVCQWDGAQITEIDPVVNSAPAGWPASGPATQATLRKLDQTATGATAGNDPRVPTQAENDALQGTSGAPANGNRFVTDADPRNSNTRTPSALSIVDSMVSATAAITEAKLALATDAAPATGSRRTLGRGANQAAQGSDPAIGGPWAKDDTLQAGNVSTGDFAAGGTLTAGSAITLAAGALWLPDANGLLQRHVRLAGGNSGQVLGANPANNTSRVDVLYAVYAGPGQEPTYQYVAGAQQGSVLGTGYSTAGIGAAPANSIPLELYVFSNSAGTTTITRYDRRSRAGGFLRVATRTAGDLTFTSTSFVVVDAARLQFRVECTGKPLRFKVQAEGTNNTANAAIVLGLLEDGAAIDGTAAGGFGQYAPPGGTQNGNLGFTYTKFPTAGSHLYALAARVSSGTGTIFSSASTPLQLVIEEMLRKDVSDNGLT